LLWAFVGYPAFMLLRPGSVARGHPDRTGQAPAPRVSVILAVRNAADALPGRVANLLAQDYPGLSEVIVISNGSIDSSASVAADLATQHSRVTALTSPAAEGKAGALNRGVAHATGDILVFADARQRFHPLAIRRLVRAFRDPEVGGVTGRLFIGDSDRPAVSGVVSYWKLETRLRMAEARTGSVVGATGAIYAVRRHLFVELPPAVILDDVYLPMAIVRGGHRVTMAPLAVAYDRPGRGYRSEYQRRVRTLVGNIELLRLMPWLLSPVANPIWGRYVSHKLLRLLTPVLCVGLVVSGLLAPGAGYQSVAAALLAVYALGAVGLVVPFRLLALPSAFLLLHTAGFTALLRPGRRAADVWAS
jgi:cellulose synthase/poly-beta-1,6-N-acetylglucosamine synthase-like glycosyltransferase